MSGGFVCFGDSLGLEALASFRQDCVLAVVDPTRLTLDEASVRLGGGIPARPHPDKAQRAAFEAEIAALAPALGVVFSYSRILWPDLIARFPLGIINLHTGPLPTYRGANVLQWAIINGETTSAATLHYLDHGIDTGPVIAARTVPILWEDSALQLRDRLVQAGSSLLAEWLPQTLRHRVPATPQDDAQAHSWPRRRPEDGEIDWNWPDRRIYDFIRALVAPWPGASYRGPNGATIIIDRMLSLTEIGSLRRSLVER